MHVYTCLVKFICNLRILCVCVLQQGGIIKHGSQMINAVSNSGVPHLSVIVGSSYGAGNYAMCGRMVSDTGVTRERQRFCAFVMCLCPLTCVFFVQYRPRFLWSWPNSKCAVMGPDQLAGTLDIVSRRSAARRGVPVDEAQVRGRHLPAFSLSLSLSLSLCRYQSPLIASRWQAQAKLDIARQMVEETADVYFTSSRCIDDGIIDPRDTRRVLAICLDVIHGQPVVGANTFGISRL